MASVSLTVIGDETYRNCLHALARDRGTYMAQMVREALDEKYGAELKPYIDFAAEIGSRKNHLEREKSNNG